MAYPPELALRVQSSQPGRLLELYDLDMTPINTAAGILHFYPGSNEDTSIGQVKWNGSIYVPQPIMFEGNDVTGQGSLPRPTLTIDNVLGLVSGLINSWGKISGTVLTRYQVFSDYLDDGPNPTPNGTLTPDIWVLDRIVQRNKLMVQVECRSFLDWQGIQLPGRQAIRNICSFVYRSWTGTAFDYTNVTCPYVGSNYFTATGQSTTDPSLDVCSKQLNSGCRNRFNGGVSVPFGGFPGLQKFTT